MMGTEMVPETSVILNQLTRLRAPEDFINLTAVKASDLTYACKLCILLAVNFWLNL
jgi:hypothetical protein